MCGILISLKLAEEFRNIDVEDAAIISNKVLMNLFEIRNRCLRYSCL